jgi:5-deoxy-glucuronate isomerase
MRIGERQSVFDGFPFAVYLSQNSSVEITALSPSLEFFVGWCQVDEVYPERLITPDQVGVEIRGGGHATRQINSILPAGSACQRLVCVEVYTPGGNWSSYPPHKHDVHRVDPEGRLVEADLEEVYYYQIKPPQGFAIQRVYNEDRSLDQTVAAHHHDMVLIPEGYHPVSAAWGYDCYYLNLLAGSAQSLANQDDPAHTWVKEIWGRQDPRLPLV